MTARKTTPKTKTKTKTTAPKQQFFYFENNAIGTLSPPISTAGDRDGLVHGPFNSIEELKKHVAKEFDTEEYGQIDVLIVHKSFKLETKTTFIEI